MKVKAGRRVYDLTTIQVEPNYTVRWRGEIVGWVFRGKFKDWTFVALGEGRKVLWKRRHCTTRDEAVRGLHQEVT